MPGLIGIRVVAVGPSWIRAEMPVDSRTRQPMGLLHGGASMVLAETLGSYASHMIVSAEPGARVAGVEINGSHVKAVRGGLVTGTCRPLKLGRTLHFWRIDIEDEAGNLLCSSRLTVSISRPSSAPRAG